MSIEEVARGFTDLLWSFFARDSDTLLTYLNGVFLEPKRRHPSLVYCLDALLPGQNARKTRPGFDVFIILPVCHHLMLLHKVGLGHIITQLGKHLVQRRRILPKLTTKHHSLATSAQHSLIRP